MSDRRGDQGAPLFPRRTLSGPEPSGDSEPAESGRSRTRSGRAATARTSSRRSRDAGPQTEAMPRVDEQNRDQPDRDQQNRDQQNRDQQNRDQQNRDQQNRGRQDRGGQDRTAGTGQQDRRAGTGQSPTRPAPAPAGATVQQPAEARGDRLGSTQAAPEQQRQRGKSRRARLRIVRLDPWSVMKMAFALSIALAVVTLVAVAIVWSVLDTAGVWESINTGVDTLNNPAAGEEFEVEKFVGLGRVMGLTMVVSLANVILLTALATLAAFIYNLAAALLGGFEVTLSEDR